MIKNVKSYKETALISDDRFRNFIEVFESEVMRGIATFCVLNVIKKYGDEGTYGYQILKDLDQSATSSLIIEEGRLYPLLRNLEKWGPKDNPLQIIIAERRRVDNRSRKYYILTEDGKKVYNHLEGLLSQITFSISNLLDMDVNSNQPDHFFCPNCSNKIYFGNQYNYCEMCGFSINDYKIRYKEGKN